MTSSDAHDGDAGDARSAEVATGLLVLRDADAGGPDVAAVDRLVTAIEARGLRCGPRVGPVIAVTGPTERVQAVADHVDPGRHGYSAEAGLDPTLLDVLDVVETFTWDEGAETF